MTKYVSTDYTGCDYITPGKRYEVTRYFPTICGFEIVCDNGTEIMVGGSGCTHTKGGNWTVHDATSDTPKEWCQMTREEKGELLLAHHEGKAIEFLSASGSWKLAEDPSWLEPFPYRIKPQPVTETVTLMWCNEKGDGGKLGTINLIDGKPDLDSITMERIND